MEQPVPDFLSQPCAAFEGPRCIASGALVDVALAAKAAVERDSAAPILMFDDVTGAVVDLDLRGTTAEIVSRLAERSRVADRAARSTRRRSEPASEANARGRRRPKLGVVAREVSLLPRHWEWLAAQSGGASATLRRLVDEARRGDGGAARARARRGGA